MIMLTLFLTTQEVPAIRGALELMGCTSDFAKIAVVICQKRHNTRLVYDEVDNLCTYILIHMSCRSKKYFM